MLPELVWTGCVPLPMHTCHILVVVCVQLRLNVYLLSVFLRLKRSADNYDTNYTTGC